MPKAVNLEKQIFNISNSSEFNDIALKIFHFQYEYNSIYSKYVQSLGTDISKIFYADEIPYLPIEFFKSHKVISYEKPVEKIFSSSGTTGIDTSKHYIADMCMYKESFTKTFDRFYGKVEDYVILALLPSYLEREGSSLVFMAEKLIEFSAQEQSGFYLHEYEKLKSVLLSLKEQKKKVILLGVTYALLDMAEDYPMDFPELIVMETGGMKGKRNEMVREDLHSKLCEGFGVDKIHSEYGMTELLSQAYSKGEGIFECPPWMNVKIRDINDPLSFVGEGKTGGLNIIDMANLYSCSFIETKDLGRLHSNNTFEVLGRFDNSDIRGCNLLI